MLRDSRDIIRRLVRDSFELVTVAHYIALIHKDSDSSYGVSFPDLPGVITAGDTIDAAMKQAAEVLAFAAEDWRDLAASEFPGPRTIDQLREDPEFEGDAKDAIVVAVPFEAAVEASA
jgi:antitoxin HicB